MMGHSPGVFLMRPVALVAFVLAFPIIGCQTGTANKPAPPSGPAIVVSAGEMLKEYGANAVAADAKYKGKLVRVTGKFGSAQKAPLLGYAVQVLPEDAPEVNLSGIECFITEAAQADIANFQPGQMITIEGMCDGQVVGQVKFSKCSVVK
jgi:hypothetical protein